MRIAISYHRTAIEDWAAFSAYGTEAERLGVDCLDGRGLGPRGRHAARLPGRQDLASGWAAIMQAGHAPRP
ncbi:MAG: hypothetical protein U0531_06490 [Dehalococcoidia bacterium]